MNADNLIDIPVSTGKLSLMVGDSIYRTPARAYETRTEHLVAIGDEVQAWGDEAGLTWTVHSWLGERGELHLADHRWPQLASDLVMFVRDVTFRLERGHHVVVYVARPVPAEAVVTAALIGLGMAPGAAVDVVRKAFPTEYFDDLDNEVGVCGGFVEALREYDGFWAKKLAAREARP